jgi:hypothetical protein
MESLPPELFLESYPPPIRVHAERLRAIVRRAVPDVVERVRPGWRLIGYDVPVGKRFRYFAWIAPEPIHVHLGFEVGTLMADPEGVLQGAHLKLKKVRFLTFRAGDRIPDSTLVNLTREAARIAAMSREERLSMVLDRD